MAWTDFVLEIEGEELAAHSPAEASPVFAAMLDPGQGKGRAIIQLPAAVGRAFVRFIYLEEMEEGIMQEEVVARREVRGR